MHGDGNPWNGRFNMYYVTAGDTTAIYVGDVVKLTGTTGTSGESCQGHSVDGMPIISRCTIGDGTDTPVGVVVGFLPEPSNLGLRYRPTSGSGAARIAQVVDDPNVIFEVQEDAATTSIAAASVGLNATFSVTAGLTTTGESQMELISTSVATTTTHPVRILRVKPEPGMGLYHATNNPSNGRFLVKFNAHVFRGLGTTGF
jgi:hypothetical protein